MLRRALLTTTATAPLRSAAQQARSPAVARTLATSTSEFDKMVNEALAKAGIQGKVAAEELSKLKANQIVSLDLLKGMNHHDWEKSGVTIGAARAIQDGLWQAKQQDALKKLNLRREHSTKVESAHKRL